MDDAALVRSACDGDKDAVAQIYDRYSDRLYSFLCSIMRSRDDAADALQDTFVMASTRLHQLRDPEKLRPWLFAIARHVALRGLGRAARQEPVEDLEVADTAAGPEETARQAELSELLWLTAGGLNPRDRVILDLHLRQGMEGKELGEAIGVSAGHADVLMSRMRDQVERSLGALLIARSGRKECENLRKLLSGWDGRFTPAWRKRVARHVDRCDTCSSLRTRLVSPASLLSALPIVPAPPGIRDRLMDEIQLVAAHQTPAKRDGWSKDGFPPPMYPPRRKKGGAAASAAACLLIAFMVPQLIDEPASDNGPLPTLAPLPTAPLEFNKDALEGPPSLPTTPASVPLVAPKASNPPGMARTSTTRAATTRPKQPATTSTQPAFVAPTTTVPPAGDEDPPALASLAASPSTITASGSNCGTGAQTAKVSATAADPSGIAKVVLKWSGPQPGSRTMSAPGGSYSAAIGPFPASAVPPSGSVNVPFTVTATDKAGNPASRSGSLKLVCNRSSGIGGLVTPTTTTLNSGPAG